MLDQIVADEKLDEIKDAEMMITRVASRRDMATQMSPEDSSSHSSPRGRSSFCHSPPPIIPLPAAENDDHSSKLDIREVQIDKRATITNCSKRHVSRRIKKGVPDFEDFYQNSRAASALSLDISEAATNISKYVLLHRSLIFVLHPPITKRKFQNKRY